MPKPQHIPSCHAIEERIAALDRNRLEIELADSGFATAAAVLAPGECTALCQIYTENVGFRKEVNIE